MSLLLKLELVYIAPSQSYPHPRRSIVARPATKTIIARTSPTLEHTWKYLGHETNSTYVVLPLAPRFIPGSLEHGNKPEEHTAMISGNGAGVKTMMMP